MTNLENINLKDIQNISAEEFEKKIMEWIYGNGVSEQLHSRMRCHLIENFDKTKLGKQIESQFKSEYRMILSPVILALNTLVAEFLYSQNCHYTLSVFSAEVPFKNTLPEFEKREYFRFNKSELNEIFEALGFKLKTSLPEEVSESYFKNNNKGNNSLLYFTFKSLFNKVGMPVIQIRTNHTQTSVANNDNFSDIKPNKAERKAKSEKNITSLDSKNIKYLNRYLISMAKKIKEISKNMEQLKTKNVLSEEILKSSKSIENMEALNCSLEKLINEFHLIDQTNTKSESNEMLKVITSINSLTDRFEDCTRNFENLIQTTKEYYKEKDTNTDKDNSNKINTRSYADWENELKESRYGKRFLRRIETYVVKTIGKEKSDIEKSFEEKLEKEKSILKLHYRQKFLEQLNIKSEDLKNSSETQRYEFKELIEAKLKIFFENHEKEIDVKNLKIQSEIGEQIQSIENKIQTKANNSENKINRLSKHNVVNITITPPPQLENSAPVSTNRIINVESTTRNAELAVAEAKNRLKLFERESEELDRSFQNYLKSQLNENSKLKSETTKLWNNYNFDRTILKSRPWQISTAAGEFNLISKPQSEVNVPMALPNVSQVNVSLAQDLEDKTEINFKFENPFKKFDTKSFIKEKLATKSDLCIQTHPIQPAKQKEHNNKFIIESVPISYTSNKLLKNGENKEIKLPDPSLKLSTLESQEKIKKIQENDRTTLEKIINDEKFQRNKKNVPVDVSIDILNNDKSQERSPRQSVVSSQLLLNDESSLDYIHLSDDKSTNLSKIVKLDYEQQLRNLKIDSNINNLDDLPTEEDLILSVANNSLSDVEDDFWK